MHPDVDEHGCVISVAAQQLGLHANTLRKYEREGLVAPSRSAGNSRRYSIDDLRRLDHIKRLVDQRGVNLAGVAVALEATDRALDLRRAILRGRAEPSPEICHALDALLATLLAAPDVVTADVLPTEETYERRASPTPRGRDRERRTRGEPGASPGR